MSVEKEKRRKKVEISHSLMGVNGVDTPDPHHFSDETDRFTAVSKSIYTAGPYIYIYTAGKQFATANSLFI